MNGLTNATVDEVILVNPTVVKFRIDLTRHEHLRNPDVVTWAMTEYVARYRHNVWGWEFQITGDDLLIFVNGRINPEIVSQFTR